MSFTPGPWISGVLGHSEADTTLCYVRSENSDVTEALMGGPDICLCQNEANSHLIAAAPDLLAFVRASHAETNCICKFRDLGYTDMACTKCDAAKLIARATGK